MKNVVKYLFSFLGLFLIGTVGVNALEIDKDDVANSTYVIGTHMFTRDANSDYNGQLTTKHIMLAAKTIVGNDLDDMIIYYKNARGNWVDAMEGTTVTMPETIEIEHTNSRIQLETPTLTQTGAMGADVFGNSSEFYNVGSLENATGVELYFKSGESGSYSLLKTVTVSELTNMSDEEHGADVTNGIEIEYKRGYHYYYKIRTYKTYGTEKVYSNYSDELYLYNAISTPTIELGGHGADGDGDLGFFIKVTPNDANINVYYSTSENGEYSLQQTISLGDYNTETGIGVIVSYGKHYYYKVRLSYTYDDETLYGEYSNVLDFNNPISTPALTFSEIAAGGIELEEIPAGLLVDSIEPASGVEVYRSTSENGDYELIKTVSKDEYDVSQGGIRDLIPYGKHYYYKVRLYVTHDSETIYGAYSNVINRNFPMQTPVLSKAQLGASGDGIPLDIPAGLLVDSIGTASGVEVYRLTSEDGEYELFKTVSKSEYSALDYGIVDSIPVGSSYSYKVRLYVTYDDKTIYSEYSNIVNYDNELN